MTVIDIIPLSYFVTCITIMCDAISHSLPKSKEKKRKTKNKIEGKQKRKIKEKENK